MLDVVYHDPSNHAGTSCGIRIEGSIHGSNCGVQGTSAVETKPSKPDENRSEEDERGVMRLCMKLVTRMFAFSKNECVRQRRPARRNMNRSTASEVQRREFVEPSIGIPSPASNWTVHQRRPEEPKDQRRNDSTSLKCSSDYDLHRASAKQQLVKAKDNLWDERASS